MAAGSAATALPWMPGCGDSRHPPRSRRTSSTAAQRKVIEELAAAIVPEDETVGAIGTDAVEYIDRYLAAFDAEVPTIYRGGPFSGREPFPDPDTGDPSGRFPDDASSTILPPTRMQERRFRIELARLGRRCRTATSTRRSCRPRRACSALYQRRHRGAERAAAAAGRRRLRRARRRRQRSPRSRTTSTRLPERAPRRTSPRACSRAPEYGGNRDARRLARLLLRRRQPAARPHALRSRHRDARRPSRPAQPDRSIRIGRTTASSPTVESFVAAIAAVAGRQALLLNRGFELMANLPSEFPNVLGNTSLDRFDVGDHRQRRRRRRRDARARDQRPQGLRARGRRQLLPRPRRSRGRHPMPLFSNDELKLSVARASSQQQPRVEPRTFRTAEADGARTLIGDVNDLPKTVGGGGGARRHEDAALPRVRLPARHAARRRSPRRELRRLAAQLRRARAVLRRGRAPRRRAGLAGADPFESPRSGAVSRCRPARRCTSPTVLAEGARKLGFTPFPYPGRRSPRATTAAGRRATTAASAAATAARSTPRARRR